MSFPPSFVLPDSVVGFSDYFRLNVDTESVVMALGYAFTIDALTLPATAALPPWLPMLQEQLQETLTLVSLTSETARRETLIAPVLLQVSRHLHTRLRIEHFVEVDPRLRGALDYLLLSQNGLLVIEAKQGDLSRGFTQLAAELIALDRWASKDTATFYGAVTLGNVWQFGVLHRDAQLLMQDTNLFRVPEDIPTLIATLIGILNGE